ncbi:MAG: hypothetical protein GY789_06145 [Hyphomicrobiales bacterium]|nr:hypothetical protein [Hyphomicrobiales bacterium]
MTITTLLAVHSADEPIEAVKPVISLAGNLGAHLNLVVYGILKTIPATSYPGLPVIYNTDEPERVAKSMHTPGPRASRRWSRRTMFRLLLWLNASIRE